MSRRQVGAIDGDLLDRVDEARGDVPRTKVVEKLLVEWLESRALGAVSSGPPDGATPSSDKGSMAPAGTGQPLARTASSTASPRASGPKNETPLPKVAERHWAK